MASDLAKRSRNAQMSLFEASAEVAVTNTGLAEGLHTIVSASADTLAEVHRQARRYSDLEASAEYRTAREVADAWCAAFLWHKIVDAPQAITQDVYLALQDPDDHAVPQATHGEIARLREQYRFLHWHLAFPDIFAVRGSGAGDDDDRLGGRLLLCGGEPSVGAGQGSGQGILRHPRPR